MASPLCASCGLEPRYGRFSLCHACNKLRANARYHAQPRPTCTTCGQKVKGLDATVCRSCRDTTRWGDQRPGLAPTDSVVRCSDCKVYRPTHGNATCNRCQQRRDQGQPIVHRLDVSHQQDWDRTVQPRCIRCGQPRADGFARCAVCVAEQDLPRPTTGTDATSTTPAKPRADGTNPERIGVYSLGPIIYDWSGNYAVARCLACDWAKGPFTDLRAAESASRAHALDSHGLRNLERVSVPE